MTTSGLAAARAGVQWEADLVRYLVAEDIPTHRVRGQAGNGGADMGDLYLTGWLTDAKNHNGYNKLPMWLDDLEEKKRTARIPTYQHSDRLLGVNFVKLRQRATGRSAAVMSVADFAALVRLLRKVDA